MIGTGIGRMSPSGPALSRKLAVRALSLRSVWNDEEKVFGSKPAAMKLGRQIGM